MYLQETKLKFDQKYLQDFFEKRYDTKLIDNYFNYIDFENIVIFSQDELKEIYNLTKQIDKIILKTYKFYIQNIEENLKNEYSLFIDFLGDFKQNDYLIGRYDVIIEKDTRKLKFIEFNANTPGMITDIYHITNLQKEKGFTNINSKFQKYISEFFYNFTNKKIAILLPAAYEDEDYLVCRDYGDILQDTFGKDNIIIGDIYESNIVGDEYFTLKGEKIDIILNFFPLEFFLTDIDYANEFFSLIKNQKLCIFNNFESIVLQDKLIFASIWENIDKYTIKQQEIIKNHIPYTTREFSENLDYIAKYRWGRLGRGVYDKNFYTNIENKEDFIYQQKINSQIMTDKGDFLVLGIYTNLKNYHGIISRKQNTFITNDTSAKVCLCYEKD